MPLHLIEGLDMWDQELGLADVILVCGSYDFSKKDLGLKEGYGNEALHKFPSFNTDMYNHMKIVRKPVKKLAVHIYGFAIPTVAPYKGSKLGIWQVKKNVADDVDMDIVRYSINLICHLARSVDRIALEYPSPESHAGNMDELYPILARVPENCVFYYPAAPVEIIPGPSGVQRNPYAQLATGNSQYHRR